MIDSYEEQQPIATGFSGGGMKACQADPHIAWAMSMIVVCCIDCRVVIMGSWQTPSITMYLQTLCLPRYGGTRYQDKSHLQIVIDHSKVVWIQWQVIL